MGSLIQKLFCYLFPFQTTIFRSLFCPLLPDCYVLCQRILHAIQQADPFYNHLKWAEEAQQNEVYMRNICQMPVLLHPAGEDTDDEGMYADEAPR